MATEEETNAIREILQDEEDMEGEGSADEEFIDQPVNPKLIRTYEEVFNGQYDCVVKQLVEVMEVVLGFETENKYQSFFKNGCELQCFEESSFFSRWFCGSNRPFKIHVVCNGEVIMMLQRKFYLCCPVLKVYDARKGKLIGKVKQDSCKCRRSMTVYVNKKKCFRIYSPCCSFWVFYIKDLRKKERVGSINKKWSGLFKEWVSDADNFGVKFPIDATNEEKACIFAATFLIDFLYFENNDGE